MQDITIDARVMVLPRFRYSFKEDDDNYWTGHVVDYCDDTGEYGIVFGYPKKFWYIREHLCIVES